MNVETSAGAPPGLQARGQDAAIRTETATRADRPTRRRGVETAHTSCRVKLGSGEHDYLVIHANSTALYDTGTDTTASFERLGHSGLSQPLYVPADRARPCVLEGRPANPEPPPAQVPELYAAEDNVSPVLAVEDADTRLLLYGVKVFCRYQGNLAYPAEAGPVAFAFAIAVACKPAAFDRRDLLDAFYRRSSSARHVDSLYEAGNTTSLLAAKCPVSMPRQPEAPQRDALGGIPTLVLLRPGSERA
jgi:hypothetical protein